jgi:hypothetical protein
MLLAGVRVMFLLLCVLSVGCTNVASPTAPAVPSVALPTTGTLPTTQAPPSTPGGAEGSALLPDASAAYTLGDTARLSGGEFFGDQADLTVIEAIVLAPTAGGGSYAFLVEITGLDPETFPYNLRDFRLIDDQAFQYEPLFDGGETPRLEFGDLSPDQKVRGWLTFEDIEDTATIQLQYAPALALEPAVFGFVVPA